MKDSRFRKMPAHGIIHLRNLWSSVMLQAIQDASLPPFIPRVFSNVAGMRQAIYRDTYSRLIASRARAWFSSVHGDNEPGSFVWICDLLQIPVDSSRKRILAMDPCHG